MTTLEQADVVASILHRLRQLRPDSRARWGRMNAHQMVCHLSDAVRVPLGERSASPATGLAQRTLVKWIALYLPLHWPAGIQTRPEIDQECGGTKPAEFARDIAQFEALFQAFLAQRPPRAPHPIFGEMSERQWLRWGYLHADHHLRQFGV
jgi:hypothetical protein